MPKVKYIDLLFNHIDNPTTKTTVKRRIHQSALATSSVFENEATFSFTPLVQK